MSDKLTNTLDDTLPPKEDILRAAYAEERRLSQAQREQNRYKSPRLRNILIGCLLLVLVSFFWFYIEHPQ